MLFREPAKADEQVEAGPPNGVLGQRRDGLGVTGRSLGVDDFDIRRRADLERGHRDAQHLVGMLGGLAGVDLRAREARDRFLRQADLGPRLDSEE